MALIPQLNLISLAADASGLVVADATGNYSGVNPGGYEAPNPAKNTIASILLQLCSFKALSTYVSYLLPATADILGAGQLLVPANFPGITGSQFEDGVYELKYDVCFPTTNVTVTAGTTQFALLNADTVLEGCVGLVFPSINPSKVFYLDHTKPLTAAGGYVTEAFDTAVTPVHADALIVYEGSLKFLVAANGRNCLLADIASWAEQDCGDAQFFQLQKRHMLKLAMEEKFSQQLLLDAHNLAVKLSNYCSTSNDCGC